MYRAFQCSIRVHKNDMNECERFLAQNLCSPRCTAYNKRWARFIALVTPEEKVILKLRFSNVEIESDPLGVMGSVYF